MSIDSVIGRAVPRQARSRERLARIVRSAGELIDEMGIDRLSIEDVATRAGTSVGSIYRFVATRDELLALVATSIGEAALASLADIHTAEQARRTPEQIAHDTVERYLAFIAQHPGARGLLAESSRLPRSTQGVLVAEAEWRNRVERFLGDYSPELPRNRRRYAAALLVRVTGRASSRRARPRAQRAAALGELELMLASYLPQCPRRRDVYGPSSRRP
jgi:AcrR family transcriptional regulator